MVTLPGNPLSEADFAVLEAIGIPRGLAQQALLRRVSSLQGREIVGRNGSGDYAGVVFPYCWPGETNPHEYRLRRDKPELTADSKGNLKERNKYLSPPGRGNRLYFVPGTSAEWLGDASMPIVITEGEKKTLALYGLSWHALSDSLDRPRFLPVGIPGVWNWCGSVGKAPGPDGDRRDVKGPIPDLARLVWNGRRVYIVFDTNVRTNGAVRAARDQLARELRGRGATIRYLDIPDLPGVNGIDDLVGVWGPDRSLALFETAEAPQNGFLGTKPSQATQLINIVSRQCRSHHTPEGITFAEIDVDGHVEIWPDSIEGVSRLAGEGVFCARGKTPRRPGGRGRHRDS
jgi:hypothetical protein